MINKQKKLIEIIHFGRMYQWRTAVLQIIENVYVTELENGKTKS